MKEGLRSGKLYAKVENSKVSLNQVAVEGRVHEENHVGFESGGGKDINLVLSGTEPQRESLGLKFEKKCDELSGEVLEESGGLGGDEDRCEKVEEVADSGWKRKRLDGRADICNGVVLRKKVKEEQLSDEVQVGRRVLRSSSVLTDEGDKLKTEDVLDQESRDGNKSEKKWGEEKEVKREQLASDVGKQSERKRGRPPLVKRVECDASGLKKLKGKRGRPRKVEKEEHYQLASDGGLRKKLKRKRGRPLKVQESSKPLQLKLGRPRKLQESPGVSKLKVGRPPKIQERNGDLKLKLGRPRKVEKQENKASVSDGRSKKLKGKRGRPPKVQLSNEVLKGDVNEEREVGADDKRQPVDSILQCSQQERVKPNLPAHLSCQEMMQNEEELDVKGFSLAKKNKAGADLETKETEASSGKRTKKDSIREGKIKKKDRELEPARSVVKQSVREKIIELLLSAGWTIEHRPRAGRAYADAVYVSPDGKTHWSVTLAYRKLKKHYEDGDGDSKFYKAGFKFIPISNEEFSILKRVILKKREGKKKLKPMEGKSGNKFDDRISGKTKYQKKLVGKSQKGRPKGKSLPHDRKNSAGRQHKGMPILVRDHNRKKTQNVKRRTLLVRNAVEDADSDSDGYIPYAGKRTVLSWMVDLGTVSLNGKVHYMNRRKTRPLLEGRITRDGILCDCCSETFTISKFETHAGSKLCEPFNSICLESGTPLLQCLLDSWNKQQESERKGFHYVDVNGEDPNDDTCGICGDGGDLFCCDGCPSTFHQSCLDIQKFPSGDWHCVYCTCKFCGMPGGRDCQENDNGDLVASEFITCQLCEEKFHRLCSRSEDAGYDHSRSLSFCGKKCQQLFKKLKTLLGVKHDLEEGFSWTLVHRSDVGPSTVCDISQECDVSQKIESNSKLAVALSIMDECFLPMVDHRSGINLIHNIVYNFGSNFNRLNYSGFFTAILERGDEIVCAASIRIHGDQLAEMPFIGTRYMYRRQGMCRRLLCAIESVLCSLDVERLVIPAISELTGTWTSVFGFRPLEVSHKQQMKKINMLVFPGIQMLQKPLLETENAEENLTVVEGPSSRELEHQTKEEVFCKTDETCTKGCVPKVFSEANTANGANLNESALESSLQLPYGSLNNTDRKCLVEFCMAHDNSEGENKSIVRSSGSICGLWELTAEISDCQNAVCGSSTPVIDQKGVELGRQSNQCGISEEDSEILVLPCTKPEATKAWRCVLCASKEDTESADCQVEVEDPTVTENLNCHEGHRPAGINTSDPPEKTLLPELEVSVENIVCLDSRTRIEIANGDRDFKCHHHEHCLEEKMIGSREMQNDIAAIMRKSLKLDEKYSRSPVCSVSQNLDTSKVSVDAVQPILNQQAEGDSKDSRTLLPVDRSYSDLQSNGLKSHEVLVSAPVDSNCDPSCASYVDSNGLCKSKEVISGSLGVMVDAIKD
ncbi:Protein OBERON [Trema orientale]|uniref:Protein OBERON n=1 Tax=Trema orientale TaxID=63057 RepID=A0A2P5FAX1_TREOI|nr:Protein OBERON [Trema orientale]